MNLNTPEVALLVLACLLVGYGLAELFRRRTTTPQNPQTQNTQSAPQPTTAEDMVENRIAMEDPAPPANAGKSVGYRLYIQRDNMSGKIVLVQRTKWGEDAPETQPVLSTNISVETTEEDARFARIREELEELRRELNGLLCGERSVGLHIENQLLKIRSLANTSRFNTEANFLDRAENRIDMDEPRFILLLVALGSRRVANAFSDGDLHIDRSSLLEGENRQIFVENLNIRRRLEIFGRHNLRAFGL